MHGPPVGMEDYHRTPKAAHSTPSMSRVPPRSSPQSQSSGQSAPPSSSGMSRMSQVIEDSIRGHLEAAAAKAAAVEQQPQRKRNSDPMYGGAEPESDEMFSRYGNSSSSSRYGGPTGHPPQPPRSRGGPVGGYPGGHPMPGPHEMMEKWSGPPLPPENAHGESREARASYIPGRGPPPPGAGYGGGGVYPPPPPPPPGMHPGIHGSSAHNLVSPRKRLALSPPPLQPPGHHSMAPSSSSLPPKKQHFEQPSPSSDYGRRGESQVS